MCKEFFSADIAELGISQMYLCEERVLGVEKWFDMAKLGEYVLPVFDFGNGRLTLTDGHSRAFVMLKNGAKSVAVELDNDEMITSELGQRLYKRDIEWCGTRGLFGIADLAGRMKRRSTFCGDGAAGGCTIFLQSQTLPLRNAPRGCSRT